MRDLSNEKQSENLGFLRNNIAAVQVLVSFPPNVFLSYSPLSVP